MQQPSWPMAEVEAHEDRVVHASAGCPGPVFHLEARGWGLHVLDHHLPH